MCLSADLPAKSAILNMVLEFNGKHSCVKGMQKGENSHTITGGNIHIFPYQEDDPKGPPRKLQSVLQDAQMALNNDRGEASNGVKGPSFLMFTSGFHFVHSVSIDYMHCILLGITRLLTKLWFDSSFSKAPFSLYVNVVDSNLSRIKPTHAISRLPRNISEHFKF